MVDKNNIKKVNRIAAIIYVAFMSFIMLGTYISQQQKADLKQIGGTQSIAAQINLK